MHEYRDSLIAKEMRAVWSEVSELDQHIAHIFAKNIPQSGNMQRVLVIGAHDTMIPAVLGGTEFNFVVFALVTHIAYMERQWNYLRLARMRYDGRCLARPLQSPYKAMPVFGEACFKYILVLPDADFDKVRDFCVQHLDDDGVLIIAQRGTEVGGGEMNETWRVMLKATDAGYCIETDDEERAEWVVVRLR